MAEFINIHLQGATEINGMLARAEKAVGDASIKTGLKAGANLVKNEIKRLAPWKRGVYRRSINQRSIPGKLIEEVGTNQPQAAIQEYGGSIKPKNKKFLRFVIDGKVIYTKGPVHIPAHPHFRPGLRKNKEEVRAIILQVIRTRLLAATR